MSKLVVDFSSKTLPVTIKGGEIKPLRATIAKPFKAMRIMGTIYVAKAHAYPLVLRSVKVDGEEQLVRECPLATLLGISMTFDVCKPGGEIVMELDNRTYEDQSVLWLRLEGQTP